MDLNIGPSSIPMAPMGMLQPLRAPLSLRFSSAILSITFAMVNQCVTNGHSLLLLVFSVTVIALAFASTLTVFTGPGCAGETKKSTTYAVASPLGLASRVLFYLL